MILILKTIQYLSIIPSVIGLNKTFFYTQYQAYIRKSLLRKRNQLESDTGNNGARQYSNDNEYIRRSHKRSQETVYWKPRRENETNLNYTIFLHNILHKKSIFYTIFYHKWMHSNTQLHEVEKAGKPCKYKAFRILLNTIYKDSKTLYSDFR